jgi:hypothetical protein
MAHGKPWACARSHPCHVRRWFVTPASSVPHTVCGPTHSRWLNSPAHTGRDPVERALLARIDTHGPMAASNGLVPVDEFQGAPTAIVVEASSPGFAAVQVSEMQLPSSSHDPPATLPVASMRWLTIHRVQVSIPVSTDPATASVMNVAQAGAGQPVDFFGHSTPPNEASY